MLGRKARNEVCARIEALGYQHSARRGHADLFENTETGHGVLLLPYPRWGRRIDVLTLESSFPLPRGGRATALQVDLGSQVHPDGEAVPGRWRPEEVVSLVEEHLVGYLERAGSVGEVLDMLLAGDVRPVGSGAARAVIQHGYFLTKWWRLGDRLPALREVAERVPTADRRDLSHAPWGRTELAEVLWHGLDLPEPPPRLPWGPGDQGDPRAEAWYRAIGAEPEQAAAELAPHIVMNGSRLA